MMTAAATAGNLERRALIKPSERDYALNLHSSRWGSRLRLPWEKIYEPARHFARVVPVHPAEDGPTEILDRIIRFPSAPIYGVNRKRDYQLSIERPNMHTLRLFTRPGRERVDRVFLFYSGLNEADTLVFYYRLADWILRDNESASPQQNAACLVAPFPGHLMHSPFHGPFSQTPLSRYLDDAGDLFRQFLRYMVEMRWLLSIITNARIESWMVGGELLRSSSPATAIETEWRALYAASNEIEPPSEEGETPAAGLEVEQQDFRAIVDTLTSTLGRGAPDAPGTLPTHVVGYSLGGFLAQSVFFAWPQVVSSCTTICSGGAIREMSPTAFAHAEEWQAVLHALRPEIEDAMLSGRLRLSDADKVAGMPAKQFGYFQRIFDQVFLQENRGSYEERLSEYGSRMLFVSGGEDPIIKPSNILDASPKEGITMLSVANLTHFLAREPGDDRPQERAQREFWLPEVGRLISHAATRSEKLHRDEQMSARAKHRANSDDLEPKPAVRPKGRDLSSPAFEDALNWVIEGVEEKTGWLFVCRNALPAAFLQPAQFTTWGTALHHHDIQIQIYANGLKRRAVALDRRRDRVTLVVPRQLGPWFIESSALFDPHSDAPSGRLTTKADRARMWEQFCANWGSCTRDFEAGRMTDEFSASGLNGAGLAREIAKWQGVKQDELYITHLPDVWIGIQGRADMFAGYPRARAEQGFIDWVENLLREEALGRQRAGARGTTSASAGQNALERPLKNGTIRVVQVSGAEFNPRYRGRYETSARAVTHLLAQCAATLVRSAPSAGMS
jgi:hypothetical protein